MYANDFLVDEKLCECGAESTGVYVRLMCLMHKSEEYGVILLKQNDKQNIKQILNFACKLAKHMPYQTDVIERSLEELITNGVIQLEGDKIIQKRMVKDNYVSIVRASAGKKGGKTTAFAKDFAQAKSQANYEYENENINDTKNKRKRSAEGKEKTESKFASFWSEYPRKIAKQKAEQSFMKINPDDELFAKIMAGLKTSCESPQWTKDGGQFIPHAATWLNGRRWEDEVQSVKAPENPFFAAAQRIRGGQP